MSIGSGDEVVNVSGLEELSFKSGVSSSSMIMASVALPGRGGEADSVRCLRVRGSDDGVEKNFD